MVVGLGGTCYLLTAAALSVSELSQIGWPVSYQPKQKSLDLGDVNLKILYEALDVVPFLDIPQTLGWEDPVPNPGAVLGWACLIVKVVLLIVVLSGVTKLVQGKQAAGAEPSSRGTAQAEGKGDR